MKRWLSPAYQWLAFWAIVALQMPSPSWACPLTGRIGATAAICRDMPPGDPCSAHKSGSCCKFLPFPVLPQNSDDERQQNVLAPASSTALISQAPIGATSTAFCSLAVFRAPENNISARPRIFLHATSPPFLILHRPAPLAPRAPPVALLS